MRNLDRTTLLALVAAKLALDDAKLTIDDREASTTGIVLGSTMGSIHSIANFDLEALREGPRYVNPAQFPNTVINSPASQLAIRFGIRGLNATVGTGFAASYSALEYAIDMIRLGRAKRILVGGAEELCPEMCAGFYGTGLLSRKPRSSNGNGHKRRCVGEGAGILILEDPSTAAGRGAAGYGEVVGASSRFGRIGAHETSVDDLVGLLEVLRQQERVTEEAIDLVCGTDFLEMPLPSGSAQGGTRLSGMTPGRVALEPLVGQCFSAMGALEIIGGIGVGRTWGASLLAVGTSSPIGVQAVSLIRLGDSLEKAPKDLIAQTTSQGNDNSG